MTLNAIKRVNIYNTSRPLSGKQNPDIFVGREQKIKDIQCYLVPEQTLLLWGQRRIGKTSLVLQLKAYLPVQFVTFYFNTQFIVAQAQTAADFFYICARRFYLIDKINLPCPARQDFSDNPWMVFDKYLDILEQIYTNQRIVLIFDEFEALEQAFKKDIFQQDRFLSYLNNILLFRTRFNLLLVGYYWLSEFPRWTPYFTSIIDINLNYLDNEAVIKLVKYQSIHYEADAYDYLCEVSHNHPMMLQILCGQLVNLVNAQQHVYAKENRTLICKADIETAISAGKYKHAFAEMLTVSATVYHFLQDLAIKGAGFHQLTDKKRAAISDSELNSLYRQGTIETNQQGEVSFTLEPIRREFKVGVMQISKRD